MALIVSRTRRFNTADGGTIEIEDFPGNLINRKNAPVDYGKPLHGWLMFAGDPSLHETRVSEYKVTCVDVFGNRHVVSGRSESFPNLFLLQDIAGIQIPGQIGSK